MFHKMDIKINSESDASAVQLKPLEAGSLEDALFELGAVYSNFFELLGYYEGGALATLYVAAQCTRGCAAPVEHFVREADGFVLAACADCVGTASISLTEMENLLKTKIERFPEELIEAARVRRAGVRKESVRIKAADLDAFRDDTLRPTWMAEFSSEPERVTELLRQMVRTGDILEMSYRKDVVALVRAHRDALIELRSKASTLEMFASYRGALDTLLELA